MEYIECASFIEIYGLQLALPISLLTKFLFFKSTHNILTLCRCQWIWCLFEMGLSVTICAPYKFHLSVSNSTAYVGDAINTLSPSFVMHLWCNEEFFSAKLKWCKFEVDWKTANFIIVIKIFLLLWRNEPLMGREGIRYWCEFFLLYNALWFKQNDFYIRP